ncbi:WD40/YVTN/BNR-like repeat-containing protein [Pseudomonas sp. NY15364]|uniref:WD40/YVTN/BNR-like repeat-containing protein n=1 Tax=Pseudomonas sp. NY15364 TaxID=3400353 RepID=UPI003A85EBF2
MIKHLYRVGLLCLLTLSQSVLAAGLGEVSSYLTAIGQAGERLVSVGERGLVLLSDDNGDNWRSVDSGVSNTLTAVEFYDDQVGLALGHGSSILKTSDAGATWRPVLHGMQLAQLTRKAAAGAHVEQAARLERFAQRIEDGAASDPLFAVLFLDARTVFVVGAYGMALRSDDGGESWRVWMAHVDNPQELHLYAIRRAGEVLYLAGEQGYLARSLDHGQSFIQLETDYAGSFFALHGTAGGEVIAAGLQGQVVRSVDQGESWQRLDSAQTMTLIDVREDRQGRLLFAALNGDVQVLEGATLQILGPQGSSPLSAFAVDARGNLLAVGALGIRRIAVANELSVSGVSP